MEINQLQKITADIITNIKRVIVGKESVIELILTALLANGHVLLEDVPGTGKTMLARSLAKSLDGDFKRIQFTPDLLPSDITGLYYYNQKAGEFVFRQGPAFTNILLADEINRATPRTQSSLLECMEEKQITIDGKTHILEKPFLVIATQNPVETTGTFPLPEAQLDRFLMEIHMGYPSHSEEVDILNLFLLANPLEDLSYVCSKKDLLMMQELIKTVYVHPVLMEYMVHIVSQTRTHENISLGVSPRGSLAFLRAVQSYAAIKGYTYVTPEMIQYLAPYILAHRLVLRNSMSKSNNAIEIIKGILNTTPVPTEDFRGR